jgi:hypothetical protein
MTEVPKICVAGADLSHADRQADKTDMKKSKLLFFLRKRLKSLAPVGIQTPVRNPVATKITLSQLQASEER